MFTSASQPPNDANAFMDNAGSRYDVNMGLDEIVVNGPGEPKKAIVSKSGLETVLLLLGEVVEPEDDATGVSEFCIPEKLSKPSKSELGESCVDAVLMEEPALAGTLLGPGTGLLFEKRLSESD